MSLWPTPVPSSESGRLAPRCLHLSHRASCIDATCGSCVPNDFQILSTVASPVVSSGPPHIASISVIRSASVAELKSATELIDAGVLSVSAFSRSGGCVGPVGAVGVVVPVPPVPPVPPVVGVVVVPAPPVPAVPPVPVGGMVVVPLPPVPPVPPVGAGGVVVPLPPV